MSYFWSVCRGLFSLQIQDVTFRVGDSDFSEDDVYDVTAIEIPRFMREDFPGLINTVREKLIVVIDERLRVIWAELEGV
ncbi:unnamed protein product [Lactuca virosa]|uniref:Uncharacterized protein n=1 Tax=Lactuca virosa TaxID=75947 RepID=A0AAU9MK07_9ASTR|nr:unnamed protein product [Lactuca virosa]